MSAQTLTYQPPSHNSAAGTSFLLIQDLQSLFFLFSFIHFCLAFQSCPHFPVLFSSLWPKADLKRKEKNCFLDIWPLIFLTWLVLCCCWSSSIIRLIIHFITPMLLPKFFSFFLLMYFCSYFCGKIAVTLLIFFPPK